MSVFFYDYLVLLRNFLVENILGRSNVAAPFEQHKVNKILQVKWEIKFNISKKILAPSFSLTIFVHDPCVTQYPNQCWEIIVFTILRWFVSKLFLHRCASYLSIDALENFKVQTLTVLSKIVELSAKMEFNCKSSIFRKLLQLRNTFYFVETTILKKYYLNVTAIFF